MSLFSIGGKIAGGLGAAAVGAGAALWRGGMIPNLLGSFGGPEQQAAGPDLGSAGAALVPQGGNGSGTTVAPGRTVIVSAPTPAPDPSLKVIVALVTQALGSLNKIDSNISAQRSEQAAAASASAKQLREATLEGGARAESAASPQMGGDTGGTGLLGLLGAMAGAAAVTATMPRGDKNPASIPATGESAGQPGENSGSSAPKITGNPIFDPLKGKGTGRKQPGLGLKRPNNRLHQGIDLFVPIGTPVYAIADGLLRYSYKHKGGPGYGFGLAVAIDHGGGWESKYAHLSQLVFNKKDARPYGPKIAKGQLIGYSGDTGNAKGGEPHLHFEIRYKNVPQEPSPYLTGQKTIPGTEDAEATTSDKPPIKDTADAAPATPKDDKLPQAAPNAPRDAIEDFLDKINPFGKTAAATPTTAPSAMGDQNPTGRKPEAMFATFTPEQAPTPSSYLSAPMGQDPSNFSDVAARQTSFSMVSQPALFTTAVAKPAPVPDPGIRTPNIPKRVLPGIPANDNVLTWWDWLKNYQGNIWEAIEEFIKKFKGRYSWLSKPGMAALIAGLIATVSWTLFEKDHGDKEITSPPALPANPDVPPDAKPGAQPAPSAVIAPDSAQAIEPAPKSEAKPAPVTPVPPQNSPFPIPLVPIPPGFTPSEPVTPPDELVPIYNADGPGLTFKDREYDTERATGVSRGSGQLGLGRSEPQTGVIGEPLLLPPTPSFTPDRRANDIDLMSREMEKSMRAPPSFDRGTGDAYTPPAKTQATRDQSDAANGGTGAGPSSVPNPSAYDIVKEYQLYFLNPSAVLPIA